MMTRYAFSSQSIQCDPAVDHAAAARAAFANEDYARVIRHCFCVFMTSPVDLEMHSLNYQASLRCGLYGSSSFSEAVLETLANDRWESIAQAARENLAVNPQDEGAAIILAQTTYFASTPPQKTALIERLQVINPHNPYRLLLQVNNAEGNQLDSATATRLVEKAISLMPDNPEILCFVADIYASREAIKDVPRALVLYEQALRLDPALAAVFFGRGITYQEQGEFAAAHADLTIALQLTPFDYRIYNARARVFQAQGDDAAALADYQRVLTINPASYGALKGVCELGMKMNDLNARRAAAQAFISSHILKSVETALTPATPVRLHLSGKEASAVRATLIAGQAATFMVEFTGDAPVFPTVLLVAPDGGAVIFAHRTFESGPTLKLSLEAAAAGEYTLMVTFVGLGEQELIVSLE